MAVKHQDFVYWKEGVFDHPQIRRVPLYVHPRKVTNAISFDVQTYDDYVGFTSAHDAVWNNLVEAGSHLKLFLTGFDMEAISPTVINVHHYVIHPSLPYPVLKSQPHIMMQQLLGSMFVDANVFNSDYCQWMLFDNAKDLLSPEAIESIRSNSVKINLGPLNQETFIVGEKHQEVTVAYNHRLQNYKHPKQTFDALKVLWDQGVKFRCIYFSDNVERMTIAGRYPFMEAKVTQTHDEYLKELSKCHVNITSSVHETFCIAAVESMAFGQILIAPDSLTFPEITGSKTNGYPFLFNGFNDQVAKIKKALTSPLDRDKWGKVVKDHVWLHYNRELWAAKAIELLEAKTQIDVLTGLKRRAAFEKTIERQERWLLEEFKRVIYRMRWDGRAIAAVQSFPLLKIKRVANQLGWVDEKDERGRLWLVKK